MNGALLGAPLNKWLFHHDQFYFTVLLHKGQDANVIPIFRDEITEFWKDVLGGSTHVSGPPSPVLIPLQPTTAIGPEDIFPKSCACSGLVQGGSITLSIHLPHPASSPPTPGEVG